MPNDNVYEIALKQTSGIIDNILIRGYNEQILTVEEDIMAQGGTYQWPLQARRVRVAAGGHADDAAAGDGARLIQVAGLDDDWNEIVENIPTAGIAAGAYSTQEFLRVNSILVVHVGVEGGSNSGNVIVESEVDGYDLGFMEAGTSIYNAMIFSVAKEKRLLISGFHLTVEGDRTVTVKVWIRYNADARLNPGNIITPWFMISQLKSQSAPVVEDFIIPFVIPPFSDIRVSAVDGAAGTGVTATMQGGIYSP